ncbi:hypothetical protein LINPERPRIM_LOCUS37384 [Linum perenne]
MSTPTSATPTRTTSA